MVDDNAQHVKEVAAQYGLAAYHAQCLEQQLENLLLMNALARKICVTREQLLALEGINAKKTLGSLIQDVRRWVSFDEGMARTLAEALDKRNYLIHRFFKTHAYDFAREDGRANMLTELDSISDGLDFADRILEPVITVLRRAAGITDEQLEQEMQRLLAELP